MTAKLTVWSRIDNPNIPKMPSSPTAPGKNATAAAWERYRKKRADWYELKDVHEKYFRTCKDKQPKIINVNSINYNFSTYKSYHRRFNSFVDNHIKRYVSIEGETKRIYWFTKAEKSAKAEAKNTIVHRPEDLKKGGLDPSIIVNPPKPPKGKK